MITQAELRKHAQQNGVPVATIDKDWMLGHFLNAMYSFEPVQRNFVFKGGTCLKKTYFHDYRFSEDLDFTLLNKNFICDAKEVRKWIHQAQKTSGARLHLFKIKEQYSQDIPQGYEVVIKFWGANHNRNQKPTPSKEWHDKIKLDISFSEKIHGKALKRPIFHPYTDGEAIQQVIPTYSLVEVLSEKLRSLIQRNRPRDIFDIWYLSKHIESADYQEINEMLHKKAFDKNILFSSTGDFVSERKRAINTIGWQSSLGHHLAEEQLPPADIAYQKTIQFVHLILKSKA